MPEHIEVSCMDEMRRAHEREFDEIKADVEMLFKGKNEAATFEGQAKISYAILMTIFLGSLWYTHNHIGSAYAEYERLYRAITANTKEIAQVQGKLNLVVDRYDRLIEDIAELNNNVTDLIKVIARGEDVQKVDIQNYGLRGE